MYREEEGRTVISLAGEWDVFNAEEARAALMRELPAKNGTELIVELGGVTFLDATMCGMLMRAAERNRQLKNPKRLLLRSGNGQVGRALKDTRLDMLIDIEYLPEE